MARIAALRPESEGLVVPGTTTLRRLARHAALVAAVLGGAGCSATLLDAPEKVRESTVFLPPFFTAAESPDGSSAEWSALLWLAGSEREGPRRHARALPFYWHEEAPSREWSLWFPLYFERRSATEQARFFSLLYGWRDGEDARTDYVLPPLFYWSRSREGPDRRSGLFLVYEWERRGERRDVSLLPLLGLATLARVETGLPQEEASLGRIEIANVLNLVTLFGYDDVSDRRDIRVLTLLGSEMLSPLRSRRGRGGDPFVREWLFPLYMNVQDQGGGWSYVGPLWGEWSDAEEGRRTDWWLLGLVSRTRAPQGATWRVLGLPVSRP